MDRMTMAIGGRVAEEIIFGRISTGAQNDLERITKMAYAMVADYGMSEKIGSVSFNLSGAAAEGPVFQKPYSDETARMIDEEVRELIENVREKARDLLKKKRKKLEEMAKTLLEKEVLGAVELLDILGPRPHGDYIDIAAEAKKAEDAKAEAAAKRKAKAEEKELANDGELQSQNSKVMEPSGDGASSEQDPAIEGASGDEKELSESKSE